MQVCVGVCRCASVCVQVCVGMRAGVCRCVCRHAGMCRCVCRFVCSGGSHEKEKVQERGKEKKIISRVV